MHPGFYSADMEVPSPAQIEQVCYECRGRGWKCIVRYWEIWKDGKYSRTQEGGTKPALGEGESLGKSGNKAIPCDRCNGKGMLKGGMAW